MKFKTIMTMTALGGGAVYGLASIIIPVQLWGFFGMDVTGEAIWGWRLVGFLTVGNAYLAWFSRQLTEQAGRRLVANFFGAAWTLAGIFTIWGQLSGDFNAFNLINIATCAIFGTLTFTARTE